MDRPSIKTTAFMFPGQTGLYHGKVRDVYVIGEDRMVLIATDRISAFDVILPRPVPYKGQILNQAAAHFLQKTSDIVPNWLQAVPDPNVSIGQRAEPFKIEIVVRGCLVGHAWREYNAGKRVLCGVPLPDGMEEYDIFPEPIITPSTKADQGHDEDITENEIFVKKLATPQEWKQLCDYALQLFARGQEMARERGLLLADTKYEFGTLPDGTIILIDEVHTPDSSRYFYQDSYDAYVGGKKDAPPLHLSKEFVREWLLANNFDGQTPNQPIPEMTDEFLGLVSDRYVELFEKLTGEKFVPPSDDDIAARIETNVKEYLEKKA